MFSRFAADAVLVTHLAFILFAVLGAALAFRWRWIIWLHLPAVMWAVYVELAGRMCPLTDLENHYRSLAGQSGYANSFIEHYVLAVIYPAGLTREIQFVLAGIVIGVNLLLYGVLIARARRRRAPGKSRTPV